MELIYKLTNAKNELTTLTLVLDNNYDNFSINETYEYASSHYITRELNNDFILKAEEYITENQIIKAQIFSGSYEIFSVVNPTTVQIFTSIDVEEVSQRFEISKNRL